MIHELQRNEFYKCYELIDKETLLEAAAVINGINSGRIFVDSLDCPATAIVWLGNNDGFLFIGKAENPTLVKELNEWIDQFLKKEVSQLGLTWFEAIATHESWYTFFENAFTHRKTESWHQEVYKIDQKKTHFSLKKGYHLLPLDHSLFNLPNVFQNVAEIEKKINECWDTTEAFCNQGIGYGIVYKNEIVSICYSGFVYKGAHNISIETKASHRGQGLAESCARAYVNECVSRNVLPYWDCMIENKPSIALARKLGCQKVQQYTGYTFPF
ncbi:GNAT family N-acetyltransferase [Shouchella sp. 1P09AA]|uniref:GNAT family N-acetyltransferase n=1 Tax=unclassified Shouchella TaxID=2893065 RepID=UPI0039A0A415